LLDSIFHPSPSPSPTLLIFSPFNVFFMKPWGFYFFN
jgi:hypothetical protein